jgi:hypothetical protein
MIAYEVGLYKGMETQRSTLWVPSSSLCNPGSSLHPALNAARDLLAMVMAFCGTEAAEPRS